MNKKLAMTALGLALFGGMSAYAVAQITQDDISNERPPKSKMEAGEAAYLANCAACHQPTGQGLAGAFPPLAKSDYIAADPKRLPEIVLHGLHGKVTVNGKEYDSVMPPMAQLTDDEVANIGTYVLNSWGNPGGQVSKAEAAAARAAKPANASDGH